MKIARTAVTVVLLLAILALGSRPVEAGYDRRWGSDGSYAMAQLSYYNGTAQASHVCYAGTGWVIETMRISFWLNRVSVYDSTLNYSGQGYTQRVINSNSVPYYGTQVPALAGTECVFKKVATGQTQRVSIVLRAITAPGLRVE